MQFRYTAEVVCRTVVASFEEVMHDTLFKGRQSGSTTSYHLLWLIIASEIPKPNAATRVLQHRSVAASRSTPAPYEKAQASDVICKRAARPSSV